MRLDNSRQCMCKKLVILHMAVQRVDKRRKKINCEYKVCWKKTWLLEHELIDLQKLLREFETNRSTRAETWHVEIRINDR